MKLQTIEWDGKKITKPGLYSGIPMDLYHAHNICDGPSISSTGLRALNPDIGSPAHFYDKWPGNPNRKEEGEKKHYILGRAIHHLILGEPFFAKLFVKQPDEYETDDGEVKTWNNNARKCREWNAARQKEGRSILSNEMITQIKNMAVAIGNHPLVKGGLFNGLIERSIFWKDKETGIWLKVRPDAIPTDSADVGDLKSTLRTLWPDLSRTLREYAYYQSGSLIRAGFRHVLDMDIGSFTLLFAEKQSPWCTRDVRIEEQDMKRGDRMNRACLRIFEKCLKEKHWPQPGEGNEGNERLGLSSTARESIDSRLKMEGLGDGED